MEISTVYWLKKCCRFMSRSLTTVDCDRHTWLPQIYILENIDVKLQNDSEHLSYIIPINLIGVVLICRLATCDITAGAA